jgi:hypothetical protein
VVLFAVAMAWVEAAAVYYLRRMIGRIDPHQAGPLPSVGNLGGVELVREAATLIMLLMVGLLAGRAWRSRLGYAVAAFGVWDVFYYVFLKMMCGWPHSLLDWDILFLLPLPWWGPVLAPMSIALLMIAWGMLTTQFEPPDPVGQIPWRAWGIGFFGAGLALYTFMADALQVAGQGADAVRTVLPTQFRWPHFGLALLCLAVPVCQQWNRLRARPSKAALDLELTGA